MTTPGREAGRRARRTRGWVLAAFVLLGALAGLTVWASTFTVTRMIPRTVVLAYQAGMSTYLVGEVAHRIDDITAALDQQPGEPSAAPQVARDMARLEAAMGGLPAVLDENDLIIFRQIEPLVASFRAGVSAVISSRIDGTTVESRRAFEERVRPVAVELQEPLDRLVDANRNEMDRRIAELRGDLLRMRALDAAVGAAFLLLVMIVAALTLRIVRGHQTAMVRAVEKVERANRDLDAFAARAAHDLRGPLAPILLFAGRLAAAPGDPQRVEQLAARITASAERANRLVEGLLAFSRGGARGGCPSANAREVVARALDAVSESATAARIELSSDVEPVSASVDASLLEQVLDNLLRNAISYMGATTVRRVRVTALQQRHLIRFSVADTGPGVPPVERERIFEPFYRIEPRPGGGVGLGLATARRIVEAHGGVMDVDDNPGGGAVFWFTLPGQRDVGAVVTPLG